MCTKSLGHIVVFAKFVLTKIQSRINVVGPETHSIL